MEFLFYALAYLVRAHVFVSIIVRGHAQINWLLKSSQPKPLKES